MEIRPSARGSQDETGKTVNLELSEGPSSIQDRGQPGVLLSQLQAIAESNALPAMRGAGHRGSGSRGASH